MKKLVKENINEAIRHLSGKDKNELINAFLESDMYDMDWFHDQTYQLIEKMQERYGISSLNWWEEDEETVEKVKEHFKDLFENVLQHYFH